MALPASSGSATLPPTVISLSPRAWLAQWPRRLQLCVVALLLLAGVAQNWHVCAMSGHAFAGPHAEHGARKFKVITNADGSPGPVICACAHEDEPNVNAFAPRPAAHDHVTCLALLLQTMPLQAGVPFVVNHVEVPRAFYAERAQVRPAFAAPFALRGRAPPLDC